MAEPLDSSSGVGADGARPVPGRPRHGRLDDGLPHDLSSFVGRERELSDVVALIERARLVTLTGPGGSGKTRLAIEAARRAAAALHLEAGFVDLAPVSDPGLMVSSIAAALDILPGPSKTVDEALLQELDDRSLLLVVDNLEQLLPDARHNASRARRGVPRPPPAGHQPGSAPCPGRAGVPASSPSSRPRPGRCSATGLARSTPGSS